MRREGLDSSSLQRSLVCSHVYQTLGRGIERRGSVSCCSTWSTDDDAEKRWTAMGGRVNQWTTPVPSLSTLYCISPPPSQRLYNTAAPVYLYIIAGIGREEPRIGWTISRRGGHCQLGGIERKKRGGEESERKKRKERKKKGNGGIVTTSGSNNGGVSGDGGSSVVKFCLYSLVMCPFDPPCAPGLRAWGTVRREGAVLRPRERERRFTGDMWGASEAYTDTQGRDSLFFFSSPLSALTLDEIIMGPAVSSSYIPPPFRISTDTAGQHQAASAIL